MKQPLISVIMPIYNAEKYLKKAIDSILNQTYKNLEIIIVNDGSNDDTESIIQSYKEKDDRIRYIYQKNQEMLLKNPFNKPPLHSCTL